MRRLWFVFVIVFVLAWGSLGVSSANELAQGSPVAASGTIRGYAFRDSNWNGVFDDNEEGIPDVLVTVSYGEYSHTYYTGDGDPNGNVPGPGSYGPTPLPAGTWKVTVHVPDGYRSTTASELEVYVPEAKAATGVDFGLYGSGAIVYSSGSGVAMGGGAGAILPTTGNTARVSQGQWIALLVALIGLLTLLGTPFCVAQVKRVHKRWW